MYLVQVWHEVLIQRSNQHVKSPLAFLSKRGGLESGFLSIYYWEMESKCKIQTPWDRWEETSTLEH